MAVEIILDQETRSKLLRVLKEAKEETRKAVEERILYDRKMLSPYGFFTQYGF
jgi:hypothetical protein